MRRIRKGCSGIETPLFENMLEIREEIADDVAPPTSPLPPSPIIQSSPPHQSPRTSPLQAAEGLESANTAQQLEILKLKARVKKLERLNKVKSSKLRCLKKVGTSQRIKSSEDKENVVPAAPTVSTRKRKGVVIRDPEEELQDDTPVET
nr:hypothetical protein [Tanacetum cinerariifolium]